MNYPDAHPGWTRLEAAIAAAPEQLRPADRIDYPRLTEAVELDAAAVDFALGMDHD